MAEEATVFEIPADGLSALSDDDLAGLEAEGVDAFEALDLSDDAPAETVEEGEKIVAAIREVRAERATREQAAAERAERVAAMKAEMEPKAEDEESDEPEAEDETEEPVAEDEDEDIKAVVQEAEKVAADAAEVIAEPEPVAASVETTETTDPVAKAAAAAPAPQIKEKRMSVIVASADSGFPAGERLDDLTVASQAFQQRLRGISGGRNTKHTAGFASIRLDMPVQVEDFGNDLGLAMEAAVKDRTHVDSLTAAAGWSSPSETMYDLCQYEQATNLLSLPEVGASRGGLRFTREPDFDTIYSGTGFDLTEAQVIADTSKGAYDVPDVAFVDVRLDAVGFAVRAGLLQNAAYPELVRRVIEGSLVAHQLKVNAKMIAGISTALGTALTPADEGALYSSMDSLMFVAESIRQKYRLPDTHVVNVVAAKWLLHSMKADIARRTGRPEARVADAEVTGWFAERGVKAQFVWGLDELDVSSAIQVKGKATTTVLAYPEGAFVRAQSPVIDLSAVYDSTLLDTNTYTAAFVEQGVQIVHRCLGGAAVTIPVNASGRTAVANLAVGHGTAEV